MAGIDDEALDWVVKQAAGELSEADRHAFEAWYDTGSRQQGAYLREEGGEGVLHPFALDEPVQLVVGARDEAVEGHGHEDVRSFHSCKRTWRV